MDFVYPPTFAENIPAFSERRSNDVDEYRCSNHKAINRQSHTCKGGGLRILSNLNCPKED